MRCDDQAALADPRTAQRIVPIGLLEVGLARHQVAGLELAGLDLRLNRVAHLQVQALRIQHVDHAADAMTVRVQNRRQLRSARAGRSVRVVHRILPTKSARTGAAEGGSGYSSENG